MSEELGEFIEILPPQKRVSDNWYLGTADAVYQNLYSLAARGPAARDHPVGRPRLQDGLRARCCSFHIERGAAATLATLEVPVDRRHRFGVIDGRRARSG